MNPSVRLRYPRLLTLLGLLLALGGLLGFWWPHEPERELLTVQQSGLLNPRGEDQVLSLVIAGRDYDPVSLASSCRWVGGECIRDRPGRFVPSSRTDTILYVSIIGNDINVVAIPRDIYLADWQTKINAMLLYRGPEGLREAVSDVLGVPVDHYAIIDINIFQSVVDALGGIDINVPYRMYYRDSAADLLIDLEPGQQRMDGQTTAGFVRFRDLPRGDIDRIDNVKQVAFALLQRLKDLNVRAVAALPQLIEAYYDQVTTDLDLATISRLLPRLGSLQLSKVATLPVTAEYRVEGVGAVVGYDAQQIEEFLAELHGGTARQFSSPPDARLLITNASGQPGIAEWYGDRLEQLGVNPDNISVRDGSLELAPSRVLATGSGWADADWFTALLEVGKQQVDRLSEGAQLELILGQDVLQQAGIPVQQMTSGAR